MKEKLRAAIKRISMGQHIDSLSNFSSFLQELNKQVDGVAFTNCNIFDGVHPIIQENMTVLITGDKISKVGLKDHVAIPENFFIIDGMGQTIMPGFIDSHIHLGSPFTYDVNISAIRQMRKQLTLNNMRTVYSGVTTICDMGGPQGLIKEFQKLADKNIIPGPEYLNCYTLISPRKGKKIGYPTQVKLIDPFQAWLLEGQVATRPKNIKDLKRACYKVKDKGAKHIKITYQPHPFSAKKFAAQDEFPIFDDEWMKTMFLIGKETDLFVSIHSPFGESVEKCIDLAIKVGANIRIQHMTFDIDLKTSIIKKMKDYGFYFIPTIMVYGDSFKMPGFVSWLNENPKTHMTPEAIRQLKTRIQKTIDLEKYSGAEVLELDNVYFRENFDYVKRNTQRAHDAGIMGFGTDIGGTYTGFFGRIFSEVTHYFEFGIALPDILTYMTSANAKIYGIEDRGIIQSGKKADLIAFKGDPFKNVSLLKEVYSVMKGGVFLKYEGTEFIL